MESYAMYLLRRFRAGENVRDLVESEGVPRERVILRLLVAVRHERTQKRTSGRRTQKIFRKVAA